MRRQFTFIFLIFISQSFAQKKNTEFHFTFGPTISLPKTTTQLDWINAPEIKSKVNLGLFIFNSLEKDISNSSSIGVGLNFNIDRFSIIDKIGPSIKEGTRTVTNLTLPIYYRIKLNKNGGFSIGLGGFSGLTLTAREKGDGIIDYTMYRPIDPNDPILIINNNEFKYNNNISSRYNTFFIGGFIDLKKNFKLRNREAFYLLRLNQYFNAIKNTVSSTLKNEKESTTLNLGIGLHF